MIYSWSFDGDAELWNNGIFDTVAECIADAKETNHLNDNQYDCVYICEAKMFEMLFHAESLLEYASEQAFDLCGDASCGWLDNIYDNENAKHELEDGVNDLFKKWCKKHNEAPSFFAVDNIKKYELKWGNEQ